MFGHCRVGGSHDALSGGGYSGGDSTYMEKEINKQDRTSQSSLSVYSRDEAERR